MNEYQFFMQREKVGEAGLEEAVNLEEHFKGLKYARCSGLNSYGKIKNIYTETYAETDELRVFIPDKITRENTEIEFEFAFVDTEDSNRMNTYHQFAEFISGRKITYWDTCRNREVKMILLNGIPAPEEMLYGSVPYLKMTVTFKNLMGSTTTHG